MRETNDSDHEEPEGNDTDETAAASAIDENQRPPPVLSNSQLADIRSFWQSSHEETFKDKEKSTDYYHRFNFKIDENERLNFDFFMRILKEVGETVKWERYRLNIMIGSVYTRPNVQNVAIDADTTRYVYASPNTSLFASKDLLPVIESANDLVRLAHKLNENIENSGVDTVFEKIAVKSGLAHIYPTNIVVVAFHA